MTKIDNKQTNNESEDKRNLLLLDCKGFTKEEQTKPIYSKV